MNPVLTLNLIGIVSFHFTILFRAEFFKFDYFIWKKANLQLGTKRKQASTKNKPICRSLLSMHLTFFLFFYLFEILH